MSRILGPSADTFRRAATVLQRGGVVGFPTETYYGLAVDPFNADALESLFALKRRPTCSPILVLVRGIDQCSELLAEPPGKVFTALAKAYWPGPLTLVCRAKESLPPALTGGTGTVGIRQSPHPVANELIRSVGRPITATSANLSGMPPAVDAQGVDEYFRHGVEMIIDGGRTTGNKGSTLLRCDVQPVVCIREGVVAFNSIPKDLLIGP